jgi:photosystem II stability/assembly factor-like uncharacterized protein
MKSSCKKRTEFLALSLASMLLIISIGCEPQSAPPGTGRVPTADAGPDKTVAVRSSVLLDGSGSTCSGAGCEIIVYRWSFLSKPAGSNAEMTYNVAFPTGRFTPDSLGVYEIQLSVEQNNSSTRGRDEVIVTAAELGVPYAIAGPDQMVDVGVQGTFDGSGSYDPDQNPLTYEWATAWPQRLVITDANSVDAKFVLADPGVEEAELTVFDGTYEARDVVKISSNPPTITNVDPLVGGVGTVITIDGSNFHPTTAWNQVTIGDAACTVLTSTATQITAEIPPGPYPNYPTIIKVKTQVTHGPDTAIGPEFNVASWVQQSNPATTFLHDVFFLNDTFGMVVGVEGVFVTADAGANWAHRDPGVPNELRGICIMDANTATAVGAGGTIIRTINGGDSWSEQTSNTLADFWGVSFIDVDHGIAVGFNATIAMTSDGGGTWTATGRLNGLRTLIADVQMMDANTIWAVGGSTIFKTTNGGVIWETQGTINPEIGAGLCFTDLLNGTMVGGAGSIIRTGTGGLIWEDKSIPSINQLYDVSFFDSNNGVVVGVGGMIYRTTNGGDDWFLELENAPTLEGVFMTGTETGYAVGHQGLILRRRGSP